MINNTMKMELDAISQNESFARAVVGAFFSQLNPTLDELADVKTAVSEAITNAIVHGYGNRGGKVYLTCTLTEDTLSVELRDAGVGIADVEAARQPFFTSMPGEERSGMGFTVMETFMDELAVTSQPGEGTTVRMKKRVESRPVGAPHEQE